jgi:hypothetical protein
VVVLFMVVERFREGNARPVYERARERGRMLPPGLRYVDSWVEANLGRCFQLMECDDLAPLMAWIARWTDLVEFEVIPVVTSGQASAVITADEPTPEPAPGGPARRGRSGTEKRIGTLDS